jgi:cell wall-associated NlpC family hydrolase
MLDREKIIETARGFLNTPFKHQGRNEAGIDCAGLIINVGQALGYIHEDYRYENYGRIPHKGKLEQNVDANLEKIELSDIQPGDIFLMTFNRYPQHLALVTSLSPLQIIHSYSGAGAVVEHICDGEWKDRVVAAYSYKVRSFE